MNGEFLCCDKDIARELRLSASWVRKQRWLRRHGADHVLRIDPVLVGNTPRYRTEDFRIWIEGLQGKAGA
jgi:hypothetical protein